MILRALKAITGLCLPIAMLIGCGIDLKQVVGPVAGPGFGNADINKPLGELSVKIRDRADAIQKYLSGRELAPIEGVWLWEDNQYEAVIIRNTLGVVPEYEYVGIITDTQNYAWKRGDVKLLLKETASPRIFTGIYFMEGKQERGTSFVLSDQNLIEYYAPTGSFGASVRRVLIRVYPKDRVAESEVTASGTAFVVSPGILATNYHILMKSKNVTLHIGNSHLKGELFLHDPQNDLALIKILDATNTLGPITCLTLGNPDIARGGDKVYALGVPLSGLLGTTVSVSEGLITNTIGVKNDPRMFQISAPIQPGSSGSPLFNSQGRVIGVVTSTLNNKLLFEGQGVVPQNVNFAIKISYLRSMLALVPGSGCTSSESVAPGQLSARDIQERFSSAIGLVEVGR
jgi:S1-C subfamily serine protease